MPFLAIFCILLLLLVDIAGSSFTQCYQLFGAVRGIRKTTRYPRYATSTPPPQQRTIIGVGAPLLYSGPYPTLKLRFPSSNNTILQFVLDTGANTNTIESRVANKLQLPTIMTSSDISKNLLGSAGVGGSVKTGDIVRLGDCVLEGVPMPPSITEDIIFMRNLSAASMEHATPTNDGLLSLSFFDSFPAGVEFDWHGGESEQDVPAVAFYYGQEPPSMALVNLTRVSLQRLPVVQVMTLTIHVNTTTLRAILDTGSPITILTPAAATTAGIEKITMTDSSPSSNKLQIGEHDDAIMVRGVDSRNLNLYRSRKNVSICVGDDNLVRLGAPRPVYIGELPAFEIMRNMIDNNNDNNDEIMPDAILGLDFLRQTKCMLLRVTTNEVWFEEENDIEK